MQAGPSGPPSAGPSGPPSAGPSGPPSAGPAGSPPPTKVRGPPRSVGGPPKSKDMDEGAFDRLSEENIVRQREIDRREKAIKLKKIKNSKRNNVVLLLLFVVVFGGLALWPFSQGDVSKNPHEFSQEVDIINRNNPDHAMAWEQNDIDLMSTKVWDGGDDFSGSFQHDLILPGIPVDINGITTVPVEIRLVSYRTDGSSSGFRVGLFPNTCDAMVGQSIPSLDERYRYSTITPMLIGTEVSLSFEVPAGRYCLVFEYNESPVEQGFRATIDAEVTPHWNQPLFAPLSGLMFLLAIFAGIGAHKSAQAWKRVAQPESPNKQTTEEEVLEQAEEERGTMSEVGDETTEPEVATPDAESPTMDDSTVEEGVEPQTAEPVVEPAATVDEQPSSEPVAAQPTYTDDELRALGWTDQQIEWHRQAEAME